MNIYKEGFVPIKITPEVIPEVNTADHQPTQLGGLTPRVRQSVVNTVIKSRGHQTTKLQPLLSKSPLQRQYLGTTARGEEKLPKRVVLEGPDYDFREINKVLSIDGFAARAMRTLISSTLKGHNGIGFKFTSDDDSAKQYVLDRLEEMTFAVEGTGSVPKLIRKLVHSFVTKSNVIIIIHRNTSANSTKRYVWKGQTHREILAIEAVDPTMVDVARSSVTGDVLGFRLRSGSANEFISFSDCYLLKWEDMRQDHLFAQPIITPVLDDIIVLRRIEEIHELAIGKATFPLVHVAIGDPKRDPKVFGVGSIVDNEINRARDALESQAPEGFLVTPHYYKLDIIQPDNIADFLPYMHYYRDRIITGLNMDGPSMGLGDTSNRNTATSMSMQLLEKVRDIRWALAEQFNTTIIREILVEGGFHPVGKSAVYLQWDDPDAEATRARENHYLAQYVSGGITLEELREKLGRRKLTKEQEKDLATFRNREIKFNETMNTPVNQHKKSATRPSAERKRDGEGIKTDLLIQASVALDVIYYTCKDAPENISLIVNTHFEAIQQFIDRYNIEGTENLKRKILNLSKNLIDKFREGKDKQDILFAFDVTRAALQNYIEASDIRVRDENQEVPEDVDT